MLDKGLTNEEVKKLQEKYGKNELNSEKKEKFIVKVIHIICEPMFLLLILAATIYFVLGEPRDGIIMLVFVIGIISIDVIQEWKTDKTLNALKDLSEPKITVLRNSQKIEIPSSELVPGDIMYIHEGIKIPADGFIIKCSGLKVDESSLTGESINVWKTTKKYIGEDYWRDDYCYQGTLVTGGTGVIRVDKTGKNTEYGKIGLNISKTVDNKTLLQKQTDNLVKLCAIVALVLFILVGIFTYLNIIEYSFKDRIIKSILSGITLAMAMIPEEFPVVLTIFLSMGAWRLAKKNSLVKKLPSVETLGAVSVLCVDKTGTITKNQMEVVEMITNECDDHELSKLMCLGSEEQTYDPMEKALFNYAQRLGIDKTEIFNGEKIKEYPFSNENKMVGYVWKKDNKIILVAKGSPESIIKLCNINAQKIEKDLLNLQKKGLRVIAVAFKEYKEEDEIEEKLEDARLNYVGLIGLIDPPRETVSRDIDLCKKAGVRVVMITGDNGITASSVAKKIGIDNYDNIITGEMLEKMSDKELQKNIKEVSIFSRVIPEHKMRIVKAFQATGEIVAMTGDGVNDAPALKQADIGIAMGQRGSEVSREAADLILMDDNFSTIVDTIKDGRRIYDNIRKAVGYIFVIHIPIALSSLFAPILGISTDVLMLLPLHVVLLELIIDPTCSIVLERQPAETNIMERKPRNVNENIANNQTLIKSFIQGLIIFISSFGIYYYFLSKDVLSARTMGLLIIMISNIFLIQVNSSDYDYAIVSLKKLLKDKVMIMVNIVMIIGILLITYSPLNTFLKLKPLTIKEFLIVVIISFISVFWYEIVKLIKNRKVKP